MDRSIIFWKLIIGLLNYIIIISCVEALNRGHRSRRRRHRRRLKNLPPLLLPTKTLQMAKAAKRQLIAVGGMARAAPQGPVPSESRMGRELRIPRRSGRRIKN